MPGGCDLSDRAETGLDEPLTIARNAKKMRSFRVLQIRKLRVTSRLDALRDAAAIMYCVQWRNGHLQSLLSTVEIITVRGHLPTKQLLWPAGNVSSRSKLPDRFYKFTCRPQISSIECYMLVCVVNIITVLNPVNIIIFCWCNTIWRARERQYSQLHCTAIK